MGNKNGETSATATTVVYASQSTINLANYDQLYFYSYVATRTEPYRNSILAKKKKKQKPNQNKTKHLENRFRFDCCTGSSLAHFLFPDLRSFRPAPRIRPWFWRGSGQTDRTWPVHRLPSLFRKVGERHRFFPREGWRLYPARSEPPCSIPAIFLQHINLYFQVPIFYFISISNCVPKIVSLPLH